MTACGASPLRHAVRRRRHRPLSGSPALHEVSARAAPQDGGDAVLRREGPDAQAAHERVSGIVRRRLWALVDLAVGAVSVVLGVVVTIRQFPTGLCVLLCVAVAATVGWYGLLRRGIARVVGLVAAGL